MNKELKSELKEIIKETRSNCCDKKYGLNIEEAIAAIEKLIEERYTPKTDVMEYVSEIHNLKYTAQEAFEKAMTALFGDEWRKMFRAEIVSDADKSLRNAFGIKEGNVNG